MIVCINANLDHNAAASCVVEDAMCADSSLYSRTDS